jgi:hypothetical protein
VIHFLKNKVRDVSRFNLTVLLPAEFNRLISTVVRQLSNFLKPSPCHRVLAFSW